jgi:hypothetical protein
MNRSPFLESIIPSAFDIRASSFLVHIALVTLVALELLNVFIGLINAFTTLLLYDFAKYRIDILCHSLRVAAHEKMGAFSVEPFPNLSSILPHPMLDINLLRLIA